MAWYKKRRQVGEYLVARYKKRRQVGEYLVAMQESTLADLVVNQQKINVSF